MTEVSFSEVRFISYDGEWPNLCRGTLKISVDDKQYQGDCLISGGSVNLDPVNLKFEVSHGPWDIAWDRLLDENGEQIDNDKIKHGILFLVNENVKSGCCGGCL